MFSLKLPVDPWLYANGFQFFNTVYDGDELNLKICQEHGALSGRETFFFRILQLLFNKRMDNVQPLI